MHYSKNVPEHYVLEIYLYFSQSSSFFYECFYGEHCRVTVTWDTL